MYVCYMGGVNGTIAPASSCSVLLYLTWVNRIRPTICLFRPPKGSPQMTSWLPSWCHLLTTLMNSKFGVVLPQGMAYRCFWSVSHIQWNLYPLFPCYCLPASVVFFNVVPTNLTTLKLPCCYMCVEAFPAKKSIKPFRTGSCIRV